MVIMTFCVLVRMMFRSKFVASLSSWQSGGQINCSSIDDQHPQICHQNAHSPLNCTLPIPHIFQCGTIFSFTMRTLTTDLLLILQTIHIHTVQLPYELFLCLVFAFYKFKAIYMIVLLIWFHIASQKLKHQTCCIWNIS